MDKYLKIFICDFSMDEYGGERIMDEKLNFDGMKFIHVIKGSRRTPWLGTFVVVEWPLLMILMIIYILYIFQ
jgi:hypothetical protein